MLCDQVSYQGKLATIATREDHHPGQQAPVVGDDFPELADAVSACGDIIERDKVFAGLDRADLDVRPDPPGFATKGCQRDTHSHRVVQYVRNPFGKYLSG